MKRGHNKTLEMQQRIERIEEEYGESLKDIIVGFREQGCSWETIEQVLEISHSGLIQWRRNIGLNEDGRINYERRESKSDKIAREMGYRDFEALYRAMRGSGMTLKQISQKTGLSESTISENTPEELKYQWVITPEMKQARIESIAIAREAQIQKRKIIKKLLGIS